MKALEQATEDLNLLRSALTEIDERAVHAEVVYMRGSRLKAWSANEAPGAGSEEPPMLLPDRVDRWIARTERECFGAIAAAKIALERAVYHQRQLLARLTHEAAKELAEAEAAGESCAHCGRIIDRSKGERLLTGRCYACYEYRRRNDNQDAPQAVLDARLEREVAAAATAKVPGAR